MHDEFALNTALLSTDYDPHIYDHKIPSGFDTRIADMQRSLPNLQVVNGSMETNFADMPQQYVSLWTKNQRSSLPGWRRCVFHA